jgi:hypothetical protein
MRRKHKKLYELAPEPDALLAWHNFLKGWQLNPVQAGKHGSRKIGKYIPTIHCPVSSVLSNYRVLTIILGCLWHRASSIMAPMVSAT